MEVSIEVWSCVVCWEKHFAQHPPKGGVEARVGGKQPDRRLEESRASSWRAPGPAECSPRTVGSHGRV